MKRLTSILAIAASIAWPIWGFIPLSPEFNAWGKARLLGLIIISFSFTILGLMARDLFREKKLKWYHPTILFLTAFCHLIGAAIPVLTAEIILFFIPLILTVVCFAKEAFGAKDLV
jgi:hypothetical protein